MNRQEAMEKVQARDKQVELVAFFQRVLDKAMITRLSFIQRESNNYQVLEDELPNVWEGVQRSYLLKEWKIVLSFQDALRPFLDQRGYWSQCLLLNSWAIEAAQALADEISVLRFTHDRADILHQRGMYREAEQLYQQCEVGYRVRGQHDMGMKSRHMRSLTVRGQGRFREAKRLCESVVREARESGQDTWLAHPCYVLALLARDQRNWQEAMQWIGKSVEYLTDTGEAAMLAQCHHLSGEVAFLQGDFSKARTELEISLQLGQQIGSLRLIARINRLLGDMASAERNYEKARLRYMEALEIVSRLGDQPETGRLFIAQGKLMIHLHQPAYAVQLLSAAVDTYSAIDHEKGIVKAAIPLLHIYYSQGQRWQTLQVALLVLSMCIKNIITNCRESVRLAIQVFSR